MFCKARTMGDTATAQLIMAADTPAECKRLGRCVSPYDDDKWNAVCLGVMEDILMAKFGQNPKLRRILLDTGTRTIVEAAPQDRKWGVGLNVADVLAGRKWRGSNLLGQALMNVRARLSAQDADDKQ